MKLTASIVLAFCAFILGACSPGDNERAREEAHQTAEQAKRDSRVVLHEAEVGAQKASKEINQGLEKTRDKVRQALDTPADGSHRDDGDRR
jgi:hypothetical protein